MIIPPIAYPYTIYLPYKINVILAIAYFIFNNKNIKCEMKIICNSAKNLGYIHGKKLKYEIFS